MLNSNLTNVVVVKFLKTARGKKHRGKLYLYSKPYYFKISPKLVTDLMINQVVLVKDIRGKEVYAVVQEMLSLPPKQMRIHKPVLKVITLSFNFENATLKKIKKNNHKNKMEN